LLCTTASAFCGQRAPPTFWAKTEPA